MPSLMPSLLRYFTIVGAVLGAGLIGLNAMLEPGGPGPTLVNATPKPVVVYVDPQASRVERLRAEEAALAAAKVKAKTNSEAPQPVIVTEPAAVSFAPPVTQAAAQPAPDVSAPAALETAATEDEAARAERLAQEDMKQKIAAEKARKKRIARARAKALEEAASRQQDQIYYGYAPRPTYGPFGQGGGWQGGPRW